MDTGIAVAFWARSRGMIFSQDAGVNDLLRFISDEISDPDYPS